MSAAEHLEPERFEDTTIETGGLLSYICSNPKCRGRRHKHGHAGEVFGGTTSRVTHCPHQSGVILLRITADKRRRTAT